MIDSSKEYILCAAIRRKERKNCNIVYHPEFQDIYDIEIGWRHCDILHRFIGEVSNKALDQGFYTSKGRFVSREEAYEIAVNCGQVKDDSLYLENGVHKILFSEDLY